MKNKLISVIVPAYNVEKFISKCLDSIVNQTYSNLEIIVIDDGSTDNTSEILKKYEREDSRVKVYRLANSGVSNARNIGIMKATGEFIIFLDGDDWLELNTCETALINAVNYQSDIIIWNYSREYPDRSIPVSIFGSSSLKWKDKEVLDLYKQLIGPVKTRFNPQQIDSFSTAWGKMYRTNLIKQIQFIDTKIIGSEDLFFNISVLPNANTITYLPSYFSHYRKDNGNSLTKNYQEEKIIRYLTLFQEISKIIKNYDDNESLDAALQARISYTFIGLGLNIIEDSSIAFVNKKQLIGDILNSFYFREAINNTDFSHLQYHWRFFYWCAKNNRINTLYTLFLIMNQLRGLI